MSSADNNSDTGHLPTEQDFCRTAATSALLYDHSYITRFSLPNVNSRNTKITAQRYSQLQRDIKRNVECHMTRTQMDIDSHPTLTELKRDVEKAFKDTTNGFLYPVSNPIHTLNINSDHQKPARFKTNTINENNPQPVSLHTVQQILTLPRSKIMQSSCAIHKEEKTMDIDDDICKGISPTVSNHQKITPLKRKLTEVIEDDDNSPYKTPKTVKRRKLTHRRSSSVAISQSPFLQKSMSLSQTSMDLENHDPDGDAAADSIQTVESHLNTFCGRFRDSMEDIPLGHINMEQATECEQMSWMTVRFNIESLAKCHQIQSLQVKTLKQLLSLIEKQLCCSMESELIHPPNIPMQTDIDNVAKGIQAAIIALYIMIAKDIHRSLIQEDILCKIMRMITFHIANNFTPCKDEQQRTEYKHYFVDDNSPKTNKKSNKKRKKKSKKRAQRRHETDKEELFWRDINTQMNTLYADFCSSLLLLMNIYIEKEVVREQHTMELLNCCFTTFDMRNMDDIQDGCKSIIVTIFVKYEPLREDIINGIMDYYRNAERTYFAKRRIANESKDKDTNYIHLINMLILEICQCLANKMLLSYGAELRQMQLMNTPYANQRVKRRRFHLRNKQKVQKEITESTKNELFTKCIMEPMDECKRTLNDVIKGMVKMVMDTKHKGDRLVMFYKDLENVWDLTEWPVAEYALTVTLGAFHSYLTSKHIDNNKQFKAFRPYFIAGLASICATARLAKKIGTKNKIHCTSKTELNDKQHASLTSANPLDDGERIDCKCGSNKKTAELNRILMIDCDDCHSWSHGQCVGIQTKEDIPPHWICDFCQINREIERQLVAINARHAANDDQVYDESTKLHILLINYLSKQLPLDLCHSEATESWYIPLVSSHELSARQFHVIQWLYWRLKSMQKIEDGKQSKNISRLFSDYFIMPNQAQLKILPTFSDFGIHRVNMQLALERRLITLHDTMIYFITNDLHNTSSKARTKALKSLKEICDVDATILKEKSISDRVIEKFKDKSAAVREAAVDLVGNFVIYDDSSLISVYFKDLKLRIIDNAVSVRKRVIRIFREICLKSPSNPKYSEICLCLFSKMGEKNEGIKKLVANTFEEMWFSDTQILRNRVCTKNHKGGFATFSHGFIQLVEQIIHSISSSNDDEEIREYLIDLIVKMLEKEEKKTSKAQHKSDADKNRVFEICNDMVCVIIDKLKQCNYDWCALKPLMDSLYIFCKVRPLFVTPHFVTLTSYMSAPPKPDGSKYKMALNVIKTLAQILTTVMPLIDRAEITKKSQNQLKKQMIRILWNSDLSIELIYDGVYCDIVQSLCYLVQHLSKDYKFIIQNLFELPIGALSAKQHDVTWSKTRDKVKKGHVIRSLLFLGYATKYFDASRYDDNINLDKIYEIYLFFLQNNDAAFDIFHQYAIQGFIPLFCRKPSLMTREETINIIRHYLNENQLVNMNEKTEFLQTECLNALHQFFETEERRTQLLQHQNEHKNHPNGAADEDDIESDEELSDEMHDEEEQEKKDSTGINGDIAGIRSESTHDISDTGDLIHFINILSPSIAKLCSSSSSSVRNHCCQILLDWTTSLWSNPLEYLRQIIALSLDPSDEKTRNMALISFNKIIQRTPRLFNINFINGIIQCFKLTHFSLNATFVDYNHKKDKNKKVDKQIIEHVFVQNIAKLFGVLDEMNKTKQQKLISSVTRSVISYMDFNVCCKKKIMMKQKQKNYLIIPMFITFLCHFLCSIPFETYKPTEPYAVIQSLDHLLKNNMSKIKQNIAQTKEAIEQIEIGTNEELLLDHLRNLYQYSCHALLCLIIYQFRSFWCKLYNLSDQNISVYKLTANKKKVEKEKNFKAKKISNTEQILFFEFNFGKKNAAKNMMTQMKQLFDCFFVKKQINENNVTSSNKNGKRKVHNTRSRQKKQEKETKCTVPSVLIEICDEFILIVNQFMMEDLERYTQSDDEIHLSEVETKKEQKAKPKQNKKKRGRKKKKTKQIIYSDEEEEKADEDLIVYAETSSDDNDNDASDDSAF